VGEIFDPATLTPAPDAPTADGPAAVADPGGSAAMDAALAGILHPDTSSDDGRPMMLLALGALAVFLVGGGAWRWHHRSSRYFPA
jgi:hypothetical protein